MSDRPVDDECIFCSIITGDIPGRIIFESDAAIGFLDANPLAPGHTLVVPRGHYETIGATPQADLTAVFDALGQLTPAIEQAVDADGSNVGFNNGAASGQEIPHLHGHVIPRFADDGGRPIHAVAGRAPDLDDDDLDEIAGSIRTNTE